MQNKIKEILRYIDSNYSSVSDEEIGERFNISIESAQKIRIKNGYIKSDDSEIVIRNLHKDSLCWKCKNSVPTDIYGCNWSRQFLPVEGWVARLAIIEDVGESYHVYRCPKFIGGRGCGDDRWIEMSYRKYEQQSVSNRLRSGE